MKIKRIYHHYKKWEEHKYKMWKTFNGKKKQKYLKKAIEFTGNTKLYGEWMLKVIKDWPYSCEHNLSDPSINRQAWIGHAACCYAIGCPEDITRLAWHYLTEQQQAKANKKADFAIDLWESKYIKKYNKSEQLGLF